MKATTRFGVILTSSFNGAAEFELDRVGDLI